MTIVHISLFSPVMILQVSPSLLAMVCGGFGFLLLLGVVVFKKPMDKINFYHTSEQEEGEFERRRSERQQDVLQVSVEILDQSGEAWKNPIQFVNKDISDNGIFIFSKDLDILKPGQEVKIRVFDDKEPVFEGIGQVVHRQAVFSTDFVADEGGFGIKFIKKAIV